MSGRYGHQFYDSKGSVIASNDHWQGDPNNVVLLPKNGLAPPNASESALVLHLPAGAHTAIERGANGATGNALVEVCNLHYYLYTHTYRYSHNSSNAYRDAARGIAVKCNFASCK